jgi:hypothetical protein
MAEEESAAMIFKHSTLPIKKDSREFIFAV